MRAFRPGSPAEVKAENIGWAGNVQPAGVKLGNFGVIDNCNAEIDLGSLKLDESGSEEPTDIGLPDRKPALPVATGYLPARCCRRLDCRGPRADGATPLRCH